MFENAPHGAVCAALLAPVFRANVNALRRASKEPQHSPQEQDRYTRALARHVEVARIVTGNANATVRRRFHWWCKQLIVSAEWIDDSPPFLSAPCQAEEGAAWLEALVTDLKVNCHVTRHNGNRPPLTILHHYTVFNVMFALCSQIPGLSAYGVKSKHMDQVVELSAASSSMAGNPIRLSTHELEEILQAAM